MGSGLDISRLVYSNLRTPADSQLPQRVVFDKIREVARKKKLDLVMTEQNAESRTSNWFTPNGSNSGNTANNDFSLIGHCPDIFLPDKVYRSEVGSYYDNDTGGIEVPIVNYNVLNGTDDFACAFFGNPMQIAFNVPPDYLNDFQIRVVYEPDFSQEISFVDNAGLPSYFDDMIAGEASYLLAMLIPDMRPEWMTFLKMYLPILQSSIFDWNAKWMKYVKKSRGRITVRKRTFFDRNRRNYQVRTPDGSILP